MANIRLRRWFRLRMGTCMGPPPMVGFTAMARFSASLRNVCPPELKSVPIDDAALQTREGMSFVYWAPHGMATDGAQFSWFLEREGINQPYRFNRYRSQSKHRIRDGHAAVAAGGIGVHLCLD